MSRIHQIDTTTAQGEARELLGQVEQALGGVPNFTQVLANSPGTLAGVLGLLGGLGRGRLEPKTRERIALAIAEGNGCQYCVSAHTALAEQTGLDTDEITAARRGESADPKADAAVKLALSINENRGEIAPWEIHDARAAGLDDAELVEVIGHVALNAFTNYLAKSVRVEVDFPEVELLAKTGA